MSGVRPDYVLPVRWATSAQLPELVAYLGGLAQHARVLVVDGSHAAAARRHAAALAGVAEHSVPDPALRCLNGKVHGVLTGLCGTSSPVVVIADDDVRWTAAGLARAVALLDSSDLVVPQNVFMPMPWHAVWDSGRTLLNRAAGGDFPGTLVARRETLVRLGGYRGDVLFENLELMRTVQAGGGRVLRADDLVVPRRPPTVRQFAGQRVRQAYDDDAVPLRRIVFLAAAPTAAVVVQRRMGRVVVLIAAAMIVVVAERQRRDGALRGVVPPAASLAALCWVLERSVTSWVALAFRVLGGMPYAGSRIRVAAHSTRTLRAAGPGPLRAVWA
jgi:hypothetical protein